MKQSKSACTSLSEKWWWESEYLKVIFVKWRWRDLMCFMYFFQINKHQLRFLSLIFDLFNFSFFLQICLEWFSNLCHRFEHLKTWWESGMMKWKWMWDLFGSIYWIVKSIEHKTLFESSSIGENCINWSKLWMNGKSTSVV